ncbi:hypothetical protein LguiA_010465 [Lonicera macranthoides]
MGVTALHCCAAAAGGSDSALSIEAFAISASFCRRRRKLPSQFRHTAGRKVITTELTKKRIPSSPPLTANACVGEERKFKYERDGGFGQVYQGIMEVESEAIALDSVVEEMEYTEAPLIEMGISIQAF